MTQFTKAVLYIAGCDNSTTLLMEVNRFGFEAATAIEATVIWRGIVEQSFVLTIIGETALPARLVDRSWHDRPKEPILMPAVPDHFELRIRNLAENLAREFEQECVAFELIALDAFELTTGQATYVRNGN